MSLEKKLKARIEAEGGIPVSDYMRLCLSDPDHGYYTQRDPLGAEGDFTTAPEISQIFGELVGAALAAQWQAQGGGPATLVELGPGRGTLMKDLLRATAHVPGFHKAINVRMVEINPRLIAAQRAALADVPMHIEWKGDLEGLPPHKLLLVANEFFDALPIEQFEFRNARWRERYVTLEEKGAFAFTLGPPAPIVGSGEEGDIFERSPQGETMVEQIAAHIAQHGGAAIIADYGYTKGKGDTLQAMSRHRYHDVLQSPGLADITAHVDFASFGYVVESAGAHGKTETQGDFLRAAGAELRADALCRQADAGQQQDILSGLERLMHPDKMGELFKVMTVTP